MSQETLKMSRKERDRALVMEKVASGIMGIGEAAVKMNVSLRQAIRVKKRYLKHGEAGLVHRSRDRVSNHRLSSEVRRKALELYQTKYWDFGPTLASEKMAEFDHLVMHPETLRLLLKRALLWQGRGKELKHRKRRARRERFGELVQVDGSDHLWFELRGPRACLMVMVDDATGRIMLHMAPGETTVAALMVLRKWVSRWGVPVDLYTDRKMVYFPPDGSKNETEFQQVTRRLGIGMIPAGSPQAKGRVENRNKLLQDRLVKEFRLRGISNIDDANAMLDDFANEMNERFAVEAVLPCDAHRMISKRKDDLDSLFQIEYPRVVARDFTYSFEGRQWQILKQSNLPAPGKRVSVCRRLDGTLLCTYQGRPLRVSHIAGQTNRSNVSSGSHKRSVA